MKKIVTISGNDYTMQSSAYTQLKYKNDTGRSLYEDINRFTTLQKQSETEPLAVLDEMMEIILKVAYTMIEESNSNQVNSFEDFLKKCENLLEDTKWINEVIQLASSPISGGNKGNPQ